MITLPSPWSVALRFPRITVALEKRLLGERVFARRLLSEDGRTTVLAVRIRDAFYGDEHRRAVVSHVEETLEVFRDDGIDFLVTGNAPNRDRYVEFVRRDNRLFLPAAFLLLLAALFLLFRRVAWAIVPAAGLGLSLVLTLTFMRLADKPVTLMTPAVPVLAAAAVSLVGLGALGAPRLRVEARILDDLPPGHPLLVTRAAVESRLGGNLPVTFVMHPRPSPRSTTGSASRAGRPTRPPRQASWASPPA